MAKIRDEIVITPAYIRKIKGISLAENKSSVDLTNQVKNLNVLHERETFFSLEEYEVWKGGRLDLGDVPFRSNGQSRDAEVRANDGTWRIHFFDVAANPIQSSSAKHGNTSMKYEQILCEIGHWCRNGIREACPKGRYGAQRGLTSEACAPLPSY